MIVDARVLLAVFFFCLMAACSTDLSLAQSGSAGGAIPKEGKTVSGGESQRPDNVARERAAPARTKPARATTARATLNGLWRVNQKCNQGQFEVELDITHSTLTEFTGRSKGLTTGQSASIVDGHLEDGNIEFRRIAGMLSDRWVAKMNGTGRFSGTSAGPGYTCSYTAVRK